MYSNTNDIDTINNFIKIIRDNDEYINKRIKYYTNFNKIIDEE
jgi:hypothetical protein